MTHGPNGWHPHLHVLVLCERDPGAAGLAAMVLHFQARWRKVITDAGYRAPSDAHGVKVERCESAVEAGKYISKVGDELARGDLKSGRKMGHRTPFEIAADLVSRGQPVAKPTPPIGIPLTWPYGMSTSGRWSGIRLSPGQRGLRACWGWKSAPTRR